jgi:hypothetical protein
MRIRWLVAGWALGSAVRRLSRRTGVTDAEAYGTLPGDEVIAHPMVEWTRGVSVRATPERIWPWLVQMGYGRAGWYTPAWVDRILEPSLFQLDTPSPTSPTGSCRSSSRFRSATSSPTGPTTDPIGGCWP